MLASGHPSGPPAVARVVVVDDDPDVVEGLSHRFRALDADIRVDLGTDPGRALRLAQARDAGGVVLVSDWMMPRTSGLQLCRAAREGVPGPGEAGRCYTILMTGRGDTESAVTALESVADDYVRKPFDPRELLARIRVGLRVCALEAELRRANRRLSHLATTDALTGLFNRRHALAVLEGELQRTRRGLQSVGLVLLDVDHFKGVNDTHGHAAGDAVLRALGDLLQSSCRRYDVPARLGGEELLLICPHATLADLRGIAERLRSKVAALQVPLAAGGHVQVTVSAGATAAVSGARCNAADLLEAADVALYAAKAGGRNRTEVRPLLAGR